MHAYTAKCTAYTRSELCLTAPTLLAGVASHPAGAAAPTGSRSHRSCQTAAAHRPWPSVQGPGSSQRWRGLVPTAGVRRCLTATAPPGRHRDLQTDSAC
jgi:hypothetical protein